MRTSSTLLTSSSLAEWKGSSCSADGGSATARKPEGMTSGAQRRLTAANQLDRVGGCDEALAPRPPPPRDRVELRQLAK